MTITSNEQKMLNLSEAWSDAASASLPRGPENEYARILKSVEAQKSEKNVTQGKPWAHWTHVAPPLLLAAGALFYFYQAPGDLYQTAGPSFQVAGISGEVQKVIEAPEAGTRSILFNEGTEVTLLAKSRATVVEVAKNSAVLRLNEGELKASVVHHSGTQYSVLAGRYKVAVTGTKFSVSWNEENAQFRMSLTEGSVNVTTPTGAFRSIVAGTDCFGSDDGFTCSPHSSALARHQAEQLDKSSRQGDARGDSVRKDLQENESAGDIHADGLKLNSPSRTIKAKAPETWQQLEREGMFAEAHLVARRLGLARLYNQLPPEELMRLARVARLAQDPAAARQSLLACRRRFPHSSSAARSAFLLGRNAHGSVAVQWFSTYLKEAPQGALAREASGRLVETHQRAGNTKQARRAARTYLTRFPSGPHADYSRGVLGE